MRTSEPGCRATGNADEVADQLDEALEGTFPASDPLPGPGVIGGPSHLSHGCDPASESTDERHAFWGDEEITMNARRAGVNVVLVHGAFVDGSGWQQVYSLLKKQGYNVSVVQNPTLSLEGDVAATRLIIDAQDGPVILVGHSYGGAVITEAGTHPRVAALVYIAAFAPDKGESVNTLIADPPSGALMSPILPPREGFLFLDREKFHASFAGDVSADLAAFMADSQVPWGVNALGGAVTEPAWRVKPSWYLLTTEDRRIPPPAQRAMSERAGSTVVELAASHAVYISQPQAVTAVIEQAAAGVTSLV
jgi:pimeloyl-ACP methyl ester carboxylesterase